MSEDKVPLRDRHHFRMWPDRSARPTAVRQKGKLTLTWEFPDLRALPWEPGAIGVDIVMSATRKTYQAKFEKKCERETDEQ